MNEKRERLKLAAKAAGFLPLPEGKELDYTPDDGLAFCGGGEYIEWDPEDDDGDALRLAVILAEREGGIALLLNSRFSSTGFAMVHTDEHHVAGQEYMGDDPDAATRLAIVRTAAAIGKAMP